MLEKIRTTEFPQIPLEQRLIELARCNKRGWIYKVGSLPYLSGFANGTGIQFATDVFQRIIFPDVRRSGVATVFQKAGTIKGIGMNQEPYYHPAVGLILDEHDNVALAPDVTSEEVVSQVSGGIDFDPLALPSWQVFQQQEDVLRATGVQVIKTQLTSMQCARFNLSTAVGEIQEAIIPALAVTHLSKAASIAPLVCVSLDNPNSDVNEGLRNDLKVMFGLDWDGDRITNYGLLDALNLVVALHCCEMYEMLAAMKSGVGLVHGDFAKYRPEDLLRGNNQILAKYLTEHGLIGVGVIPQAEDGIERVANGIGITIPERECYPALINTLSEKPGDVLKIVTDRYFRVVDFIVQTTGLPQEQIVSQCVPSYQCGFGGTKHVEVAEYSLKLAQKVSDIIHEIN